MFEIDYSYEKDSPFSAIQNMMQGGMGGGEEGEDEEGKDGRGHRDGM